MPPNLPAQCRGTSPQDERFAFYTSVRGPLLTPFLTCTRSCSSALPTGVFLFLWPHCSFPVAATCKFSFSHPPWTTNRRRIPPFPAHPLPPSLLVLASALLFGDECCLRAFLLLVLSIFVPFYILQRGRFPFPIPRSGTTSFFCRSRDTETLDPPFLPPPCLHDTFLVKWAGSHL